MSKLTHFRYDWPVLYRFPPIKSEQGQTRMREILPIQFLRAGAALAVAVMHYQMDTQRAGLSDGLNFFFWMGNAGVDVFFVISGFVMVYSSQALFGTAHGPFKFFLRRVVRILPIYWVITSVYIAMAVAIPAFGKGYSPSSIAGSYLFIPVERAPGVVEPVVGQGWTLNYEMLFYAIFAIAITARPRVAVATVALALAALVAAGRIFTLPLPFAFWASDIVLEFVWGAALGLLYQGSIRIPKAAGWALIAGGVALIATQALNHVSELRCILLGVPAALIVAGACFPEFSPSKRRWAALTLLGGASYALYLTHSFANRAVLIVVTAFGQKPASAPYLYLGAAALGAIALAIALHLLVEQPATAWLKRLVRRYETAARPDALSIAK
jgi:exopolysaccharide production protein ExoZ